MAEAPANFVEDIIKFGVCINNDDPLQIGRIRAVIDTEQTQGTPIDEIDADALQKKYDESTQDVKNKYGDAEQLKWTKYDPHLLTPFLPTYINIVPKVKENIKIIFHNTKLRFQNKEYIGPTISQPQKYFYEDYNSGRKLYSPGTLFKENKSIKGEADTEGIFPYENTIALNGRNNSDIIMGNREVIIRAGKFIIQQGDEENPIYNPRQSFLQITNFPETMSYEEKDETISEIKKYPLEYVLEYDVDDLNPGGGLFSGTISLAQIVPEPGTMKILVNEFGLSSAIPISQSLKPVYEFIFSNSTLEEVISHINNFLFEVDNNLIYNPPHSTNTGTNDYEKVFDTEFNFGDITTATNSLVAYPFYFRPKGNIYNYVFNEGIDVTIATELTQKENATEIVKNIKLAGVVSEGFGLAFSKELRKPEPETKVVTLPNPKLTAGSQGISSLVSNKIYLYSYNKTIASKGKIELDKINQPMNINALESAGIQQEFFINEFENKTDPLVRGDELLKMIKSLWGFVKTHVHPFPGMPPVPVSQDGTNVADIEKQLGEADDTILNQDIRIN